MTSQSKNGQLFSRILQELHPSQLLPSLTAGIVIALLDVVVEISFATLIFSGVLLQYVSNGIRFTLFGACALAVRRDIDLNHELWSAGIANIVAGLGGSPADYHALSFSAPGHNQFVVKIHACQPASMPFFDKKVRKWIEFLI